jgi:16S rRNA (guanine966-N2)-methyltransferase
MRIVGGTWRGRALQAPRGATTRPTADRARQALFDMLLHAPWGGRDLLDGASVLDVCAGTGALGLEALSRGAATATFIERDAAALAALRGNIARLDAETRCTVLARDPPYGQDLVPHALGHLARLGWIAPGAVIVSETGRDEDLPEGGGVTMDKLAERTHGAARLGVWRWWDAPA